MREGQSRKKILPTRSLNQDILPLISLAQLRRKAYHAPDLKRPHLVSSVASALKMYHISQDTIQAYPMCLDAISEDLQLMISSDTERDRCRYEVERHTLLEWILSYP